jgi:hypothetical protein
MGNDNSKSSHDKHCYSKGYNHSLKNQNPGFNSPERNGNPYYTRGYTDHKMGNQRDYDDYNSDC